jgi:excisionase family DNA binding protein
MPRRGGDRGGRSGGIEPRLLTLEDVATYLSVSAAQVYALVRSGELPAVKLGGRGVWRVDKRELDAYIDQLHEKTSEWTKLHPASRTDDPLSDDRR